MKYLGKITDNKDLVTKEYVDHADNTKQNTLVSGTNIKTINNQSLLGSGNITIQGGGGGDHEELTQAEYNALSQAEKENGTVYFITDASPIPSSLLNLFYPVGTYYETSDSTFNPNVSMGGTWISESRTDDEIVEQGFYQSGAFIYRKWKSGISEFWGRTTVVGRAMTNAYGNLFYYTETDLVTFPSDLFTSPPIVTASWNPTGSSSGLVGLSMYETTTTVVRAYVWSSKSGTYNSVYSIRATGLWKTYEAPTNITRWHRTA